MYFACSDVERALKAMRAARHVDASDSLDHAIHHAREARDVLRRIEHPTDEVRTLAERVDEVRARLVHASWLRYLGRDVLGAIVTARDAYDSLIAIMRTCREIVCQANTVNALLHASADHANVSIVRDRLAPDSAAPRMTFPERMTMSTTMSEAKPKTPAELRRDARGLFIAQVKIARDRIDRARAIAQSTAPDAAARARRWVSRANEALAVARPILPRCEYYVDDATMISDALDEVADDIAILLGDIPLTESPATGAFRRITEDLERAWKKAFL